MSFRNEFFDRMEQTADDYRVRFSEEKGLDQGSEYFFYTEDGEEKRVQIHDYPSLYSVPMLYDSVLYGRLKCSTPFEMVDFLSNECKSLVDDLPKTNVLELGAGSGTFAEVFKEEFAPNSLMGLDLFKEAKEAANRDRTGLYDDYIVCDLTALTDDQEKQLEDAKLGLVVVASATGWKNHIPVEGFQNAFELLEPGGWYVFHVNPHTDDSMSNNLVKWIDEKVKKNELINVKREERLHREAVDGRKIYYEVVAGQKAA